MAGKCGAKTRAGGKCGAPAMKNGRCRVHGGKSPGAAIGNTSAATHGIYQKNMTDDERTQYNALKLGDIDDELRLMRIRLSRALDAEHAANGAPEIDEITQNDGGGVAVPRESRKSKVRDYWVIIDRLTARIESLEKTRKTLDAGDGENAEIHGFEVVAYE